MKWRGSMVRHAEVGIEKEDARDGTLCAVKLGFWGVTGVHVNSMPT